MDDRSWHSDPMFSSYNAPSFSDYEDSEGILNFNDIISPEELDKENVSGAVDVKKSKAEREKLQRRTVTGVFNATPTSPRLSPPPRPATWTKNISSWSLSNSGRKESLSAKKKFMSTKEYNENLAKYQKENLELKIKCHLLQQQAGFCEDSDSPCSACIDMQVQKKILEKKVQSLTEKLREKCDALRKEDEELSGQKERCVRPSFMKHLQEDELEQARMQGYTQAREELAASNVTLRDSSVQTSMLQTAEDIPLPIPDAEQSMDANTTEYRDFPAVLSARPSLLSDQKAVALIRSPASPSPAKARIGTAERGTFQMLIKHLQEVVAFLQNGLNGQFDVSNTSLNVSQILCETTSLDISLMDMGSGEGSRVSFSLADKLQEVLELSRELSMSLEADDDGAEANWSALKAEKDNLAGQVETLSAQLNDALAKLDDAAAEKARQQTESAQTETDLAVKIEELRMENDDLAHKLAALDAEKADLESEMRDLLKDISAFEDEMQNTKAQQQILLERLQSRPEVDIMTQTDFSSADIEALRAAVNEKDGAIQRMSAQLDSEKQSREPLESLLQSTQHKLDVKETEHAAVTAQLAAVQQDAEELSLRVEQCEREKKDLDRDLKLLTVDRDSTVKHYGQFQEAVRAELLEKDGTIERLTEEVESKTNIQNALQENLNTATQEVAALKLRVNDLGVELQKAQEAHAVVEQMLLDKSPPAFSAAQQTDLSWESLKAEKANLLDTIEKLVTEVENLEAHLETLKQSSALALDKKTRELHAVTDKLDLVSTELETVFETKNELEKRVIALTEALAELEDKLHAAEEERNALAADQENLRAKADRVDKWEKAARKQVGKSLKMIKEANKNLAESSRAPVRTAAYPNPLAEKHSMPPQPGSSRR
ncbi:myosin-2 heavy chain, non muscle-like isoform X2 [Paramacrobiotus metropolitanus]|uniref:myosin-2 heavy chain, non muscle-like isoform X2 n=1 Tax=Paramacrobiotus metropolitanus TaxID=2943436 RepID=UPI00244634F0|nr:myosin-2 heavy chain, non muscle-like isoform X2 [Paramacrobiotus metropolitanus]